VDRRKKVRIIIIGPVAAGKTTARDAIRKALVDRGIMPTVLGIEEAHRQLCPPPDRPGYYHFDEGGALILEQREVQIPEALTLLGDLCWTAKDNLVLELAVQDVAQTLLDGFPAILPESVIAHVNAPLSDRLNRNASRGSLRMPMEVFKLIPVSLSRIDSDRLRKAGASLINLSNNRDKGHFAAKVTRFVNRTFGDEEC
jgi:hypothetical protein